MPRGRRNDHERRTIDTILAARSEFEAGFKRSKKGNLWREFHGLIVTVFRAKDTERFRWSISDPEGVRFSDCSYESESDALSAVESELEGYDW
jgi:hypothetical protein